MSFKGHQRRGDTHGDTADANLSDSSRPRRLRKTKPPATIRGCEYRWVPGIGWRWRARMKVGGRVLVGEWATKEDAILEAEAMRGRLHVSQDVQFVTLEEACQDVLDAAKGNDGTWRCYHEHFLTLCAFFGADEPLHAITPSRIGQFLNERRATHFRGKPPSDRRLRKHLGALGRVFRLAIRNERFKGVNPVDRVDKPRLGKRRHEDVYDVEELRQIFQVLRERKSPNAAWDMAVVAALLFTGMRREALCHVTVAMIDQAAGFIRGLEQKRTIGGSVAITAPLACVLPTLLGAADDAGHLIPRGVQRGPRAEGGRLRSDTERRTGAINRVFKRLRADLPEKLRQRFRPHAMRHTLRTILADENVPGHVRDAITDHAPSSVGRGYEHASPASVREWARRVLDPLLTIVEPGHEAHA